MSTKFRKSIADLQILKIETFNGQIEKFDLEKFNIIYTDRGITVVRMDMNHCVYSQNWLWEEIKKYSIYKQNDYND